MGTCIYCSTPMEVNRGWLGWICEDCEKERKEVLLQHYRAVRKARKAEREAAERNPVRRCVKCGRGIPMGRTYVCQECLNARQRELDNLREAEEAKAPDPELDTLAQDFNRKYPDKWLAEYMIGALNQLKRGE